MLPYSLVRQTFSSRSGEDDVIVRELISRTDPLHEVTAIILGGVLLLMFSRLSDQLGFIEHKPRDASLLTS